MFTYRKRHSVIGAVGCGYFSEDIFSEELVEVPPRLGMAGVDAIVHSQQHSGTRLLEAVAELNTSVPYDRIIVVTDEQAHASGSYLFGYRTINKLPDPKGRGYMINVAGY